MRLLPGGPARALGGLQVGFFSGARAAPLAFGALSTAVGVGDALLAVAVSAVAGAVAAGELYRRRAETETPPGTRRGKRRGKRPGKVVSLVRAPFSKDLPQVAVSGGFDLRVPGS